MTITIRAVAKQLNISITTVSRALDGYSDVASETRELVIQTAHQMGYSPNRAARQLRRQKSETIGFILPASAQRFDEPFFTEFISGLGDSLSEDSYDLLVANAKTDGHERDLYQRWMSSHKVDGFVLNRVCRKDWRVQTIHAANIPFVGLGRSQDGIEYPCVRIDGTQEYSELIHHLHAKGFSRFAFIGGFVNLINHIDRLRWCKSALREFELLIPEEWIASTDMTSSGGYEAAKKLLTVTQPPQALICINYETAFGALHAANQQGLKIGTDIAIAGFEGVRDGQYTSPPLTTLDIPVYDIAQRLVKMLLAKINGNELAEEQIKIQPKLIIRPSTGS